MAEGRWYDVFSRFYDRSLEDLYRPYRQTFADHLDLPPGSRVLLPACGTGQDLPFLAAAVGPTGQLVGLDRSAGMLARAQERVAALAPTAVHLVQADLTTLSADRLPADAPPAFDGLVFSLALSVLPDPAAAFDRCWQLLRPGGRVLIFDVHARTRNPQTYLVEWMAQADLSRRPWELLEGRAERVEREKLPGSAWVLGGEAWVVTGEKRA